MAATYDGWAWFFALVALFFWSNICADTLQRRLFVSHYGKFSGFTYSVQQIAYAASLFIYLLPGMLGIQTTSSYGFELMALCYFAGVEFTFWVKQKFRLAAMLQAGVVALILGAILYECETGEQSVHFKLGYTLGRFPLLAYFTLYLTGIMSYQKDHIERQKFFREHGRFSDFTSAHINANHLVFTKLEDINAQIVHKSELFRQAQTMVVEPTLS